MLPYKLKDGCFYRTQLNTTFPEFLDQILIECQKHEPRHFHFLYGERYQGIYWPRADPKAILYYVEKDDYVSLDILAEMWQKPAYAHATLNLSKKPTEVSIRHYVNWAKNIFYAYEPIHARCFHQPHRTLKVVSQ